MRISSKILKAILLAAGKKDIRYYLNGIHVNARHLVAADGFRLHAYSHGQEWSHGPVTIPRPSIETALKMRSVDIEVTNTTVGAVNYEPVGGTYPDYMRVIPQVSLPVDMGPLVCNVSPEQFEDARAFIAAADGRKHEWLTRIGQAWTWQSPTVAVVVMGERLTEKVPSRTNMEQFK